MVVLRIETVVKVISGASLFVEWQKFTGDNFFTSLEFTEIQKTPVVGDIKSQIAEFLMFVVVVFHFIWIKWYVLHSWDFASSQISLFWSMVDSAQKSFVVITSFCCGKTLLCFPHRMKTRCAFREHLISWDGFEAISLRDPDSPPST